MALGLRSAPPAAGTVPPNATWSGPITTPCSCRRLSGLTTAHQLAERAVGLGDAERAELEAGPGVDQLRRRGRACTSRGGLQVALAQHPPGRERPARLAADQLRGLGHAGRAQPAAGATVIQSRSAAPISSPAATGRRSTGSSTSSCARPSAGRRKRTVAADACRPAAR